MEMISNEWIIQKSILGYRLTVDLQAEQWIKECMCSARTRESNIVPTVGHWHCSD